MQETRQICDWIQIAICIQQHVMLFNINKPISERFAELFLEHFGI